MNMLDVALRYAEKGLPIFPVHTPTKNGGCSCCKADCWNIDKHPPTAHGLKDATTDTEKIREWWGEKPDANIGIPTGEVSGILALDVDPDHGGNESLGELQLSNGPVPHTSTVITGGGGKRRKARMLQRPKRLPKIFKMEAPKALLDKQSGVVLGNIVNGSDDCRRGRRKAKT
jgi:hypothetical protein